jgi:hypothetical protein
MQLLFALHAVTLFVYSAASRGTRAEQSSNAWFEHRKGWCPVCAWSAQSQWLLFDTKATQLQGRKRHQRGTFGAPLADLQVVGL